MWLRGGEDPARRSGGESFGGGGGGEKTLRVTWAVGLRELAQEMIIAIIHNYSCL